jgi:hypothetical protein
MSVAIIRIFADDVWLCEVGVIRGEISASDIHIECQPIDCEGAVELDVHERDSLFAWPDF